MAVMKFVAALFGSVLSKQLADDFKAWTPRLVKRLIERAVATLPRPDQRERYAEEWQSHANDVPGELGKVFVCLGFLRAARKMAALNNRERPTMELMMRLIDVAFGLWACLLFAPAFVAIGVVLLTGRGPVFKVEQMVGLRRRKIGIISFAGEGRLGQLLEKSPLHTLPCFINLLRGDIGLVGPRPLPPRIHFAMLFWEPHWETRILVKPGILSWGGPNKPQSWQEELAHDIFFVENRDLTLYLHVLGDAVVFVLKGFKDGPMWLWRFVAGGGKERPSL
jgi:lipopolysaccharide/colanic/teichoic acid biosynthesis glycosyltransferase